MFNLKSKLKSKFYIFVQRLYSPLFKKLDRPINSGALEFLLRKEIIQESKVLSISQTLQAITQDKKILMRLGDGELPILHGKNGGFHSYSQEIKQKLLEAYYFSLHNDDFLMAVNPDLIYPYTNPSDVHLISSCRNYSIMDFLSFFPINRMYGNALSLRISPFMFYKEHSTPPPSRASSKVFCSIFVQWFLSK